MTSIASKFGKLVSTGSVCMLLVCVCVGEDSEKGKLLGIIRSIGALGRALGPFLACTGK